MAKLFYGDPSGVNRTLKKLTYGDPSGVNRTLKKLHYGDPSGVNRLVFSAGVEYAVNLAVNNSTLVYSFKLDSGGNGDYQSEAYDYNTVMTGIATATVTPAELIDKSKLASGIGLYVPTLKTVSLGYTGTISLFAHNQNDVIYSRDVYSVPSSTEISNTTFVMDISALPAMIKDFGVKFTIPHNRRTTQTPLVQAQIGWQLSLSGSKVIYPSGELNIQL